MLDELRALDPLSRDERRDVRAIDAACKELGGELGRAPTASEVAQKAGLDTARVHVLEERREAVHGAAFDENVTRSLQVPDFTDEIAERRNAQRLEGAFPALPERHQQILTMRYREDMSLREIGNVLSVTESRACQLHAEAVTRLKRIVLDGRTPAANPSSSTLRAA
jgi:RNA polymerase sigma factor for flagellar operon FliA